MGYNLSFPILDLTDEEAFDCLTEGDGDFGVDAIHISNKVDHEFTVTLFRGFYRKFEWGAGDNGRFFSNAVQDIAEA